MVEVKRVEKNISKFEKLIENRNHISRHEFTEAAMEEQMSYCRLQELKLDYVLANDYLILEQKTCRLTICHACEGDKFANEMKKKERFVELERL